MPRQSASFQSVSSQARVADFDGLLAVAMPGVGAGRPEPGAVVVRPGVLGIEPDRLGVIGDGLVVLLLASQALPRLA